MKPGLHDLSAVEAMRLWGELVLCLCGAHGFGSDTCELYAYRFGHFSPAVALSGTGGRMTKDAMLASSAVLHALLTAFTDVYGCTIEVDGRDLGDWLLDVPFGHRTHVRITPTPECASHYRRIW